MTTTTERTPTMAVTNLTQSATTAGRERGRAAGEAHHPDHHDDCDCWPSPLSGEWAGESLPEIYHEITGRDYWDDWDRAVDHVWPANPDEILDAYEDAYLAGYVAALDGQ